jgi:hypothetical protein
VLHCHAVLLDQLRYIEHIHVTGFKVKCNEALHGHCLTGHCLTVTSMEMTTLWDMPPCSLVAADHRCPDDGGSTHL